jgi:hypothetical protein
MFYVLPPEYITESILEDLTSTLKMKQICPWD